MIDLGPYNSFLQGIYVDMDSLFDTRFAVLEQIDPLLALHNLKNGWNTRVEDLFEGIDKKTFDELYASRDNSVLAIAPATQVMEAIKVWTTKALESITGSPNGDRVVIFVNVWPYLITRDHARSIGQSVSDLVGNTVEVKVINIDPKTICTKTAKNYFSAMFMYDWDGWLEANTVNSSFQKQKIPDVTLYAPKLLKGTVSSGDLDKIRQDEKIAKMTVFDHFEITAGPMIGIEFIEPVFFSHFLPTDFINFYDDIRATIKDA